MGALRIGVDLDANVDDLYLWFRRLLKRRFRLDIKFEELVAFNVEELERIKAVKSGPTFARTVFATPFIYECAKPLPGAVETLNKWHKQSHEIWFVTARPKYLRPVTLAWLEKNNLGWAKNKVIFRDLWGDDRAKFKCSVARKLDLHVFIEDEARVIKAIKSPSLMAKLVLRYPWNINEDIGQATFVKNWRQIDQIVQNMSHKVDKNL